MVVVVVASMGKREVTVWHLFLQVSSLSCSALALLVGGQCWSQPAPVILLW